jgi:hypothetical protein
MSLPGSNDYNWLPASALKPFAETHPGGLLAMTCYSAGHVSFCEPGHAQSRLFVYLRLTAGLAVCADYSRHAAVKNKALQRAIDEVRRPAAGCCTMFRTMR